MDSSSLASSILALRSSIKSLESRSNSLESLLYVFVALVVIGVVFEVGFVVWEYHADMKEFLRGIIHSPHRPSGRILLFELIGAGLVAIGVAGELAIDVRSGDIQTTLRAKNGELIDILQNASSVALRAASENEKEAAQLRKEAAQLRKDAEGLKKQAEDERLARVRLAASIAWRTPDLALIPQLAEPLRRFARQRYAIVSDVADPERSLVIGWVATLLQSANWSVESARPSPGSELTFQATNIVLWISPTAPGTVLNAARLLIPALEHGGLPAVVLQSGWGPPPDAAPPELMRVVIFKKGPRMTVTGNVITFEGLPIQVLFGSGPPH
jgi:hypothetical protein